MSNTILIKRSGTANAVPASGNLALGELAINYQDGNLFYKDSGGSVQTIASKQFVSVSGNITGANVNTGQLSLSGNVISAINSTSNITTTANVSAGYVLGNGYFLTGVITSVANINNGTSNVTVVSSGGNITVGVGGTGNVVVFATTGQYTTGVISASGNITGDYFFGNGSQLTGVAASSVDANNLIGNTLSSNVVNSSLTSVGTLSSLSVSGNITSGNLNAAGLSLSANVVSALNSTSNITTTANAAIGNLLTDGLYHANGVAWDFQQPAGANTEIQYNDGSGGFGASANFTFNDTTQLLTVTGTQSVTGSITGGNLLTAGNVSATGNITGGNITTTGASGNIFGANVISGVTLSASGNVIGGNVNTGQLSLSGNVISAINSTSAITTTANINGGNLNAAGLSLSSNVLSALNSTNDITTSANITGGNLNAAGLSLSSNVLSALNSTNDITTSANVTGDNLNAAGLSLSSNVLSALNSTNDITTSANITGGNLNAAGLSLSSNVVSALNSTSNITTSANVSAGNVLATYLSASGNVDGSNVNVGTILYTSNIIGRVDSLTFETVGNGNVNIYPNGTGNIVLANTIINNLAEPLQNQDAATKYYVDTIATTGLTFHAPVFAATNTDLATATGGAITYAQPNGAANGIGATLTTTGSFNLIDTANIQTIGTRVLVKNEGNGVYNGVYTWSNATVIVRSTDTDQYGSDSAESFSINDYFFTQSGNVNAGAAFVVSAPPGVITFGTSNIQFSQFSSTQVYSANTQAGLSLVGTVFSAKTDNVTTAFDGGGNIVVKASAQLTTPNIGNATGTTLSLTGTITAGNVDAGSGFISTGGNVVGGNILTGGLISATGNLTAGNISTAGSGGNISGANVISGTTLSATGNVIAGNLNAAGLSLSSNVVSNLNVTSNIAGGNISTVGLLTTNNFSIGGNVIGNLIPSANVTYNLGSSSYLWKDLYLSGNSIYLGAQTVTANATGVSVGSGDFAAGNVNTTGNVSAAGNVNTGNVVNGGGNLTLTANTKSWNFSQNGNLYVPESGQIRASSSFYGVAISDYASLATLSLVDDATLQGNAYVRLQVIGGTQFDFTNGLANIKDANLSTTGNVIGGNILFGSGIVSGTGNITGGNIFQGINQVLDTASTVDGGLY